MTYSFSYLRKRVKELTSRRTVNDYEQWKENLKRYVVGWVNYFKLADMRNLLASTDEWMRRRIRMVFWKKWKRVRTRYRNLRKLGLSHNDAYMTASNRKGYWAVANTRTVKTALSTQRIEKAGFQMFSTYYKSVVV